MKVRGIVGLPMSLSSFRYLFRSRSRPVSSRLRLHFVVVLRFVILYFGYAFFSVTLQWISSWPWVSASSTPSWIPSIARSRKWSWQHSRCIFLRCFSHNFINARLHERPSFLSRSRVWSCIPAATSSSHLFVGNRDLMCLLRTDLFVSPTVDVLARFQPLELCVSSSSFIRSSWDLLDSFKRYSSVFCVRIRYCSGRLSPSQAPCRTNWTSQEFSFSCQVWIWILLSYSRFHLMNRNYQIYSTKHNNKIECRYRIRIWFRMVGPPD
jgi:hypothetical protein